MVNKQNFTELKTKYNISQENNNTYLYFILNKAEIDINLLNNTDWNYLKENDPKIYELLKEKKDTKDKNIENLAKELFTPVYNKFSFLFSITPSEILEYKHKFSIEYAIKTFKNILSSILLKLDSGSELKQTEIDYLKSNRLDESKFIKVLDFLKLKKQYKVLEYFNISPNDPLYSILKKLESDIQLTDKNLKFLKQNNLIYVLKTYELQLKKREEKFIKLKEKYQAISSSENSLNSILYQMLNNLESGQLLKTHELNWLTSNNLNDTIIIADFVALKFKYKATEIEDLSPSSNLYKVLKKIHLNIPLPENDLNFLKKRKLTETINIAMENYTNFLINKIGIGEELNQSELKWIEKNQRNDVIKLGKTKYFTKLKTQYEIQSFTDNSPESQLYFILQKLAQNQRLDAVDIAYLQDKNLFYSDSKIYICFNTIEAEFYEADYQKTGNKWNLPNISSHWRKADEPKKALNATENINFDKIKENKLKSAILTTRGGAFRDLNQLDDAEKCARKAIEYQPNSHHPYTLMGAICFDRYDRYEGERWFREAEKRGASHESINAEIKKSLERMKNKEKRIQIAKDLLKKDAKLYGWANKYLTKNSQNKK
ncbi:M48 family metallopeptidase [Geminocystis sp. NIES-3709]|uniref:tetratricopeptide repeat protein n=1 Tax=Geminocystis sp. NIES-3709 TaxID=1617448 RepID=UPI0005FCA652|nr:hypothetical protein [Geminocystis sp. NIES-3709]BAQ66613.1 hypothetical protein GM3709_3378 [Geminocystis sp. NIES-3709]